MLLFVNHQIDDSIYTKALVAAENEQNKINYFRNVRDSLIIINNYKCQDKKGRKCACKIPQFLLIFSLSLMR